MSWCLQGPPRPLPAELAPRGAMGGLQTQRPRRLVARNLHNRATLPQTRFGSTYSESHRFGYRAKTGPRRRLPVLRSLLPPVHSDTGPVLAGRLRQTGRGTRQEGRGGGTSTREDPNRRYRRTPPILQEPLRHLTQGRPGGHPPRQQLEPNNIALGLRVPTNTQDSSWPDPSHLKPRR